MNKKGGKKHGEEKTKKNQKNQPKRCKFLAGTRNKAHNNSNITKTTNRLTTRGDSFAPPIITYKEEK